MIRAEKRVCVVCSHFCTCVCANVFAHAHNELRARIRATPKLDHVRNGWWARLVVGELAGFMGRWFYERIWLIHHPSNILRSCNVGQGKGTRMASGSLRRILWESFTVHQSEVHRRRRVRVTLEAFLRGKHRFWSALESFRWFVPSWFYIAVKLFRTI